MVSIHIRRGGVDNGQCHSKWLSTITASPDVISMSFVPITTLLTGVRGAGFLNHAVNLYIRCNAFLMQHCRLAVWMLCVCLTCSALRFQINRPSKSFSSFWSSRCRGAGLRSSVSSPLACRGGRRACRLFSSRSWALSFMSILPRQELNRIVREPTLQVVINLWIFPIVCVPYTG
jgi:hypothetical protein